ncbi:corticotropin-releasing factor receptor 1-like, partial [Notothenia coriiceps]|uniref:Corticotropin-releasing factor receptor 1-like n=1 Tax=Notothenia coriiceps TaxID=8208 RepID=A0A6I9PWA1_9TELE
MRIRTSSVWFTTREFLRAFLFWRELNPQPLSRHYNPFYIRSQIHRCFCFSQQINFIFLFNIVRILMTKLRASTTSETIQYRKAVKATLVLLPLLGLTYMLFFVNPGEDEISQIVFIYFNSFLESFQGFFVSVFYCFLNSE